MASRLIDRFVSLLTQQEREFLPKKKRRALEELEIILEELVKASSRSRKQEDLETLQRLLKIFHEDLGDVVPDWDEIASRWLDIIRPNWFQKLDEARRKPLLLKDIRGDLLQDTGRIVTQLVSRFEEIPIARRPEERIRACTIGID